MAHRCLANSSMIIGVDFTQNAELNEILSDPKVFPMVLFPGPASRDLTKMSAPERVQMIPAGLEPIIIVLDGTWHLARKILHRSPNLQKITRVCFTPNRLSRFLVRKQPHPACFSSIEAIHELITLLGPENSEGKVRPHDILLNVFDDMVAKQLSFRGTGVSRHARNYQTRRERKRALDEQERNI